MRQQQQLWQFSDAATGASDDENDDDQGELGAKASTAESSAPSTSALRVLYVSNALSGA